jgi:hypothetical protein
MMVPIPFAAALARIKGMFAEMPGTEWTVTEAARLSGLEQSVCLAVLDALLDAGFLTQRVDGSYVRCRMLAPRPAEDSEPQEQLILRLTV